MAARHSSASGSKVLKTSPERRWARRHEYKFL
jgi:hypothetical protein